MSRLSRWCAPAPALALTLVVGLSVSACGSAPAPRAQAGGTASECRQQWHDVAQTVLGLDQDTDPSALGSRWTSVIATIDYYETSGAAKQCQQTIETQVKAISELRAFSDRLRPYDMAYQLREVSPSVELYLTEPLPAPAKNDAGKVVKPPGKGQVNQAVHQLRANAAAADADLQPGWAEMSTVDLNDPTAVRAALADLDGLAQDSVAWKRSEQALQVLVAASRAQQGTVGQPN